LWGRWSKSTSLISSRRSYIWQITRLWRKNERNTPQYCRKFIDSCIFLRSLEIARRSRHVIHAWRCLIFNGNTNPTRMYTNISLHAILWILYALFILKYFNLKNNSTIFPYFLIILSSIKRYFKTVVTREGQRLSLFFLSVLCFINSWNNNLWYIALEEKVSFTKCFFVSRINQWNRREKDVEPAVIHRCGSKNIRARKSIVASSIALTKTIQDKRDEWRNESIVGER